MTDSYQAIYDAVRSKISNGDIGAAITEVARQSFDISYMLPIIQQEFCIAAGEMQRPFVLLKPSMKPDGDHWCALYGENLQDGVCGFGETPDLAAIDFDKNWREQKLTPKDS